jgi:hypothetical protein
LGDFLQTHLITLPPINDGHMNKKFNRNTGFDKVYQEHL